MAPPMQSRTLLTVAGLALVVMMAAGFLMDFAIMATTSGEPLPHVGSVSRDLARAGPSTLWRVEAWTYCLMALPATLFLVAAWCELQAAPEGRAGISLLAVFWALHTLHNVAMLVVVGTLAPRYVPGAPDASAVEWAARALIGIGDALNPFVGLGMPFLALGAFLVGRASLADAAAPRWRGWALVLVAGLVAVGLLQLGAPAFLAASLVAWVLLMVWTAAWSLRAAKPATAARDVRGASGAP